jgi:flagellar biosynthesis/type III secretory pathway protein FliH
LGELRQRAQELGYEEGLRQGLAQAEQRLAAAQRDLQARAEQDMEALRRRLADSQQQEVARLKELATSLQDVLAAHLAALEKKAAQLAFAAVCKILCAPQERAQVLQAVVEGQLASFRQQGRLTVRLNPSDHQLIEASAQASAAWQWVADPRLRPGDCVIDQAAGQVDLGLDTQLTRLRDTWLMALAAEALPATDAAAVDSVALTGHR